MTYPVLCPEAFAITMRTPFSGGGYLSSLWRRLPIARATLVWVCLKQVAAETNQTIYEVIHGLLSDYLRQQLKSPAITMVLA